MIKKTNEMPLFDERFINFGFNKIEWIETLRYTGYKFAVLINGFGMDVPHPQYYHLTISIYFRSIYKKKYINSVASSDMYFLSRVYKYSLYIYLYRSIFLLFTINQIDQLLQLGNKINDYNNRLYIFFLY